MNRIQVCFENVRRIPRNPDHQFVPFVGHAFFPSISTSSLYLILKPSRPPNLFILEPRPATLGCDILRSLKPMSWFTLPQPGAAELSSSGPCLGPLSFLRPNLKQSIFHHRLEPPRAPSVEGWRRRTSFIPSWSFRTSSVSALSCRLPSVPPSQESPISLRPSLELPSFLHASLVQSISFVTAWDNQVPFIQAWSRPASFLPVWKCGAPSAWIRHAKIPSVPSQRNTTGIPPPYLGTAESPVPA